MDYLDIQPYKTAPSKFPKHFARWVDERLKRYGVVYDGARGLLIDWGCGTGDFMKAFSDRGYATKGVDLLIHAPNVVKADFTAPMPNDLISPYQATVVFSRNVLEHLADPTHLLKAMRVAMKPGGILVVAVPDWRTYHEMFYDDPTHVKPYTAIGLKNQLMLHGFDVIEVVELIQHPPTWESPVYRGAARLARLLVPLRAAQWVHRKTGSEFWRWACLRTLVAFATKR